MSRRASARARGGRSRWNVVVVSHRGSIARQRMTAVLSRTASIAGSEDGAEPPDQPSAAPRPSAAPGLEREAHPVQRVARPGRRQGLPERRASRRPRRAQAQAGLARTPGAQARGAGWRLRTGTSLRSRREHAAIPEADRDRDLGQPPARPIGDQAVRELRGAGPRPAHAGRRHQARGPPDPPRSTLIGGAPSRALRAPDQLAV